MKNNQDHFEVLRKIKSNPETTQRKLASELNFSLGKLNYCVKALQEKGLIKIQNFQKRQDKITDAPAAIELVSAKDIKREESTNLGSYLKGLKGVDFTSSGVNNYSISVRGFNSSFTSRLLTLTDGRVANIPALRVINYSTVPQSSKDIESIEVVLGPSTALYGANAHSGVVSITSKSPATSEGLDISISGSAADERDLYKFYSRLAHKINDNLSFKLSGMYLQAYEWEFISEEEYKRHKYPWSGNPGRMKDGKDNNPSNTANSVWLTGVNNDGETVYILSLIHI